MAIRKHKCRPKRVLLKNGLSLTATELISYYRYYECSTIDDAEEYELEEYKKVVAKEFAQSLGFNVDDTCDCREETFEYRVSKNTIFEIMICVNDKLIPSISIENIYRDGIWFNNTYSFRPPFMDFSAKDFEKLCRACKVLIGDACSLHWWLNDKLDLLMDENTIKFLEEQDAIRHSRRIRSSKRRTSRHSDLSDKGNPGNIQTNVERHLQG